MKKRWRVYKELFSGNRETEKRQNLGLQGIIRRYRTFVIIIFQCGSSHVHFIRLETQTTAAGNTDDDDVVVHDDEK